MSRLPVKPRWQPLAARFRGDRECLTAFLAMEGAEVVERVKPANLVNVVNRTKGCGRNMYRLWRMHGIEVVSQGELQVLEMVDRGNSLLLLIYGREEMERLLARPSVRAMLGRCAYREPQTVEETLEELKRRVRDSGTFPHEIGIFLGYPLKDVAAFLGWIPLPFSCQGPWKIYGDPIPSLTLAHEHRRCMNSMACRLVRCSDPAECLVKAA